MSRQGRVELGTSGSEISFDFLSFNMAARVASRGRERGVCIVRVTYRALSSPVVSQVGGTCAELRPVARPRCSMAALLKKATTSGTLPAQGSVSAVSLQVSKGKRRASSFWKFEMDGRTFNVPPC